MKKLVLVSLVLALASASFAATANVPAGVTGLWRFEDATNYGKATIGTDMVRNGVYGGRMVGPWTRIGTVQYPDLFSENYCFQETSWESFTCYHGISSANGGGSYINEYTVAMDYCQTQSGWNSLFQTAWNPNANDGDLFINGTNINSATIGVGAAGYSTMTFDASKWHRIVLSVDNGNFFRVYVDGVLFLDGTPQAIDGRFSLELDRFNLFADDSWEDTWGLVGTVAVWGRALTSAEVAGMGGWLDGSGMPTALVIPEPMTMAVLALGGLLIRRK